MQREIAAASDAASREYHGKIPKDQQNPLGVWDMMTKAATDLVDSIQNKDFDTYLAVAHPKNGEAFFTEVYFLHSF
ncbi:MAG TPA: hypothetical protein VEQ18_03335 [Candidatus Nitrosocosmicus sp.]|nr:hypothetical protein [Candidatus Nitrosocosmicus sp.]